MINYFSICLLVIGIVFCGVSPIKASEIDEYFASCPNNLWEQNNIRYYGDIITYKWLFGDNPANKLYKIEKYKDYVVSVLLFSNKNIDKDIDLDSIGDIIRILVPRLHVRVDILDAASNEAIENLKKKHIDPQIKTKNSVFIFMEDKNGNFKGNSTETIIKELMNSEESNEVNSFAPHPGCRIIRQVKDYDILQTFGHVQDTLDSENQLRCIATIIYTHLGISNPKLFYRQDELVRRMSVSGNDKFRVSINYTPLHQLYTRYGSFYTPLPGSTGCELFNANYLKANSQCLALKKEIEDGKKEFSPTFLDEMRNNCHKLNIEIK